jgi:hypothetical protein
MWSCVSLHNLHPGLNVRNCPRLQVSQPFSVPGMPNPSCALLTHSRTTIVSALKLYEMKSLNESNDPAYTAVNLSVFAIAEVFAGAFTASLPPLRKTFEIMLRKVLPTSLTGASIKQSRQSYALQGVESQTKPKYETDINSECGILPDGYSDSERKGSDHEIMKTTQVTISADAKSIASRHHIDWV